MIIIISSAISTRLCESMDWTTINSFFWRLSRKPIENIEIKLRWKIIYLYWRWRYLLPLDLVLLDKVEAIQTQTKQNVDQTLILVQELIYKTETKVTELSKLHEFKHVATRLPFQSNEIVSTIVQYLRQHPHYMALAFLGKGWLDPKQRAIPICIFQLTVE
jgi:hypothetical protein